MASLARALLFILLLQQNCGVQVLGEEKPQQDAATKPALPPGAVARLGSMQWRHPFYPGSGHASVSFSKDGKYVAAASSAGLALLRTDDGSTVDWLKLTRPVKACLFTLDGKTLITESRAPGSSRDWTERVIQYWHVGTGRLLRQVKFTRRLDSYDTPRFSADGKHFFVHARLDYGNEVLLRNLTDGTEKHLPFSPSAGHGIALSKQPHRMAIAERRNLTVYDLKNKKILHRYPSSFGSLSYHALQFSPSGRYLVASRPASLAVWDLAAGDEIAHVNGVNGHVAFSPDGKQMACGGRKRIVLFDVPSFKKIREFEPHHDKVRAISFSPDGKRIGVAHVYQIGLWDVATGKQINATHGHKSDVHAFAFSWDGRYLATGGNDQFVYVWDWRKGRIVHRFDGHFLGAVSVAFSPGGKILASGDGYGAGTGAFNIAQIRLWDLKTGKKIRQIPAHLSGIPQLQFSPDGKLLYSVGNDDRVRAWDVASGKRIFQLRNLTKLSFDLSEDGRRFLAVTIDRLGLWDAKTGDLLAELPPKGTPYAVRFAALVNQDRQVLSLLDPRYDPQRRLKPGQFVDDFKLIDASTGQLVRKKEVPRHSKVYALSDPGSCFVVEGQRGGLFLWDVDELSEFGHFPTLGSYVTAAAFSRDGRWLASAEPGSQPLVWDVFGARLDHLVRSVADQGKNVQARPGLVTNGKDAVVWLKDRLAKIAKKEVEIRGLVTQLDDRKFDVRKKATGELMRLVDGHRDVLELALAQAESAEVRQRLSRVLATKHSKAISESWSPKQVQAAIRLLSQLDHADADRALQELAQGPKDTFVTKQAQAALERKRQ